MEETKVQHIGDHDSEQLDVKEVSVDQMEPQQKLFYYSKRGDVEGLKTLGSSGYDINAADESEDVHNPYKTLNTALHYAVISGSLETVKICFNMEANLERKNKLESTPLHLAAAYGYTEIAQYLIDQKADLNAINKVKNKPLHCAVYAGHVEIVKYILKQVDDPVESLMERNGVQMACVKYTAHEDMKQLLRDYFPKNKKIGIQEELEHKTDAVDENTSNPTVVEEEADKM